MKILAYTLLYSAIFALTACDKPKETLYLKDAPEEIKAKFAEAFKTSCIEEAMEQGGVSEVMRDKIQNACNCLEKKAEETITIEQAIKAGKGDKKDLQKLTSKVEPFIPECLKSSF